MDPCKNFVLSEFDINPTFRSGSSVLTEEEGTDGKVNKLESNLNKMRSYFTSLKACIEKYSEIRYEEGKIEHQFHELLNERPELSESNTTSLLKSVGESNKKLYELAMNNKTELENKLFFDTESHLVWIESVIDLLQRRRELKDRLSFIDKKLQDQNDQSAQYDFANEQINLIGRCKKLTTGVIQEVDLLKKGTNEFFKDKL